MKEIILKSGKRVLVVVDLINGFVNEGKLADPYINTIVPENVRLVKDFIKEGYMVIFIKDCHTLESKEFELFEEHALEGTNEAELVPELLSLEKFGVSILKNSTDAYFAPGFKECIENLNDLKEIIVTGCLSEICVLNLVRSLLSYINQFNKDIDVIVPENAIATFNGLNHKREEVQIKAINEMNSLGAKLVKEYKI